MILAIIGSCCTGKTTLAQRLCGGGLIVRNCGEIVRQRAADLKLAVSDLPLSEHRSIDAETVKWAIENGSCVVEGHFLDQVLFCLSNDIVVVKLDAAVEDRLLRLRQRTGTILLEEALLGRDAAEETLRSHLYDKQNRLPVELVLNTSLWSIEQCVEKLRAYL